MHSICPALLSLAFPFSLSLCPLILSLSHAFCSQAEPRECFRLPRLKTAGGGDPARIRRSLIPRFVTTGSLNRKEERKRRKGSARAGVSLFSLPIPFFHPGSLQEPETGREMTNPPYRQVCHPIHPNYFWLFERQKTGCQQ